MKARTETKKEPLAPLLSFQEEDGSEHELLVNCRGEFCIYECMENGYELKEDFDKEDINVWLEHYGQVSLAEILTTQMAGVCRRADQPRMMIAEDGEGDTGNPLQIQVDYNGRIHFFEGCSDWVVPKDHVEEMVDGAFSQLVADSMDFLAAHLTDGTEYYPEVKK